MFAQYIVAFKIAAVLIVLLASGGGYWYITNLQDSLATSEANNAKLETAVQTQKDAIKSLENDVIDVQMTNRELNTISETQRKEIQRLNDRFNVRANGTSRDFGSIARDRPGLINRIVNKATVKANRCFELATGATLKKGETNAECKELIADLSK